MVNQSSTAIFIIKLIELILLWVYITKYDVLDVYLSRIS